MRYLNHSCEPNAVRQVVLTPGCSAMCYHDCLFAERDIREGEEITYL